MATLKEGKIVLLYLLIYLYVVTEALTNRRSLFESPSLSCKGCNLNKQIQSSTQMPLTGPHTVFGEGFGVSIDRHQMWSGKSHLLPLSERGIFIGFHPYPYIFLPILIQWDRNKVFLCDGKKFSSVIEHFYNMNILKEELHQKWGGKNH